MLERFLRVLMILAFLVSGFFLLNAINYWVNFDSFTKMQSARGFAVIAVLVMMAASMIQYIAISKWHPLYLFKNKK